MDYDCVHELVFHRVKCNKLVADHPTVQVEHYKSDYFPKLGIIGLINGLFGIQDDGMGAIYFEIDNNGRILSYGNVWLGPLNTQ